MKNCMNMMTENREVKMVDKKFAARLELTRDSDSRRLERSPGVNFLAKVTGIKSRRDIKAVCSAYSTLSLIRTTTRLRATCTIVSPTAALKSSVAIGMSWLVSPEGTTSEKISLLAYGVNMVSRATPTHASRV